MFRDSPGILSWHWHTVQYRVEWASVLCSGSSTASWPTLDRTLWITSPSLLHSQPLQPVSAASSALDQARAHGTGCRWGGEDGVQTGWRLVGSSADSHRDWWNRKNGIWLTCGQSRDWADGDRPVGRDRCRTDAQRWSEMTYLLKGGFWCCWTAETQAGDNRVPERSRHCRTECWSG